MTYGRAARAESGLLSGRMMVSGTSFLKWLTFSSLLSIISGTVVMVSSSSAIFLFMYLCILCCGCAYIMIIELPAVCAL